MHVPRYQTCVADGGGDHWSQREGPRARESGEPNFGMMPYLELGKEMHHTCLSNRIWCQVCVCEVDCAKHDPLISPWGGSEDILEVIDTTGAIECLRFACFCELNGTMHDSPLLRRGEGAQPGGASRRIPEAYPTERYPRLPENNRK
eukprot:gene2877-17095_t